MTRRRPRDGDRDRMHRDLGLWEGMVVQEIGWGPDVDELFRRQVQDLIDGPVVDEDYEHPVDAVLLWFRNGNGDLLELLRQARSVLRGTGFVWALTPKPGLPHRVHPGELAAAATAPDTTWPVTPESTCTDGPASA